MESITIAIHTLPHAEGLPLPSYATEGAAGIDLTAAVADAVELAPGARALVPTGIRLAIPRGYEGQVRARSGLALNRGLGVANGPGTIDSDYRGEIGVVLINWSDKAQVVRRGDRIAQLVFAPVVRATLAATTEDALDQTARGDGGFGHTGV